MDNTQRALKSGLFYIVSNFSVKAIGFFSVPVFTRILTKEEFGLYSNYTSWLSIATVVITLRLSSSFISARYDYEDDFDGYILSMLALNMLIVGVWSIIINGCANVFVDFTHIDLIYLNAMLSYLLFLPAVDLFQVREKFLFEYKKSSFVSLIISILVALLSVIFVVNMNDKVFGMILGMSIPVIFIGAGLIVFFIEKGKHIKLNYWKYALPVCLPYIPHALGGCMLSTMDRVMIERYCGAVATANYSLAYSCGAIISLLIVSIDSAFAPWLGEKLHTKKYAEINKFSRIYIASFFILSMFLILIAPEILFVLGGSSYMEAVYVINPVAIGCVCQFLYTMYVNVEQFKKKTAGMPIATVCAAIINYVLNLFFIPRYGYLSAAYTTLIGYMSLLFMHMYLVKKMKFENVYDNGFVIFTVILGVFFMFVTSILYEFNMIRYFVIMTYIVSVSWLIYNKRLLIKNFFKNKKIASNN